MSILFTNNLITYHILKFCLSAALIFSISSRTEGHFQNKQECCSWDESNQEKIYVAADRDLYIAGEEVFLKVYLFSRNVSGMDLLSKVVYVDMHDSFNFPVARVKIAMDGFSGSGVFRIPDTLRTGSYYIRSFTNNMKNFSQTMFAYKKISVVNPYSNISLVRIPDASGRPDTVIFFPETGSLVAGVETRIGMKSIDNRGEPVDIKGFIITNTNDTVASVKTDSRGTSLFVLKPSASLRYFLVTGPDNAEPERFMLPPVNENGISFTVSENQPGTIKLSVMKSNGFKFPDEKLNLLYSHAESTFLINSLSARKDSLVLLQKRNLPEGFAEIMIKDESGRCYAKRWVYNKHESELKYNLRISSRVFPVRKKVTVEVDACNIEGKPYETDLHVAVVKSFSAEKSCYNELTRPLQNSLTGSFRTDLCLSGLNDYLIFFPDKDISRHLPVCRPDTSEMFMPEINGHHITGIIKDRSTGDPVKNEKISLSFVGKTARCSFTKTDDNGYFSFVSEEHGNREIVIQPLQQTSPGYFVDLTDPFPENKEFYVPSQFYIDTLKLKDLNKAIISAQIRALYAQFLPDRPRQVNSNGNRHFYGEPDKVIRLSDYIELVSFREVIKELMPGVSTVTRNDRKQLRLINKLPTTPFETDPLVLLDGVPVYDLEKVLNIRSSDLEYVEVVNTRYFFNDNIFEGIINLVSHKGDMSAVELDHPVFRQEYNCLQAGHLPFYPDYSSDSLRQGRIPDFRNTLYWNPELRTAKDGKTAFEFFTSDEPGDYTIIVEGFAADGSMGKSEIHFRVEDDMTF